MSFPMHRVRRAGAEGRGLESERKLIFELFKVHTMQEEWADFGPSNVVEQLFLNERAMAL